VPAPEDNTLLEAARGGDGQALEALLEEHEPRLYRFARRLCRHHEDAEDVLQESLLAAARGLSGFRGDASLSTWLFTIARSHCIKKRRRRRHAPDEVSLDDEAADRAYEHPDPGPGPEETLRARRLGAAFDVAVAGLDRKYREVFLLRDVEGLTAPEVAEVTGLSVAAIKSRLHRARSRVRECLAPWLTPPVPPVKPSTSAASVCPDVVKLFSRYLEGDISPRTCARMEQHLADCPRCRASCDALRDMLRQCRSVPSPQVPPALQERVRSAIREVVASPR
jgi:RNA polymerase sigma-70 factor (ECF subfamily)